MRSATGAAPAAAPKGGLAASGGAASSRALVVVAPTPPPLATPSGGATGLSVQEFRRMLDQTKKEVREMRAVESTMRWDMEREEKHEVVHEQLEAENEIRDWRWRQNDEMREYVEEITQVVKVAELEESKTFQEFKREVKVKAKDEDIKFNHELYVTDTDAAQQRTEAAMALHEQDKELVRDRHENTVEVRQIYDAQKQQTKAEEANERVFEQNLEMNKLAKELEREREQLLQSLEYARSCRKSSPLAVPTRQTATAPRRGRP